MPNIGFFELLLISVVALLVLGPEKLPGAIRTASLWIGRARRSFNKVRSEIERELNTDEIRRQLHNESILADLEKAKKQANEMAEAASTEFKALGNNVDSTFKRAAAVVDPALLDEEPDPASIAATDTTTAATTSDSSASSATSDGADEPTETIPEKPPVQDFYNNPAIGVVQLRDGVIEAVPDESEPPANVDKKSSVTR